MHLFYLYLSFVLFSPCCYVLFHSSHSNVSLPTTCLKVKMDSSLRYSDIRMQLCFFCVTVSSSMSIISSVFLTPVSISSIKLAFLNSHFYTLFSSSFVTLTFFFLLSSSSPSQTKGCMALPLVKAPFHCKRMSLSHRKQSAFIMSYLPGLPRQQP